MQTRYLLSSLSTSRASLYTTHTPKNRPWQKKPKGQELAMLTASSTNQKLMRTMDSPMRFEISTAIRDLEQCQKCLRFHKFALEVVTIPLVTKTQVNKRTRKCKSCQKVKRRISSTALGGGKL